MCLKYLRPFCDVACFKMAWQQKRGELGVTSYTWYPRRCLKLFPGRWQRSPSSRARGTRAVRPRLARRGGAGLCHLSCESRGGRVSLLLPSHPPHLAFRPAADAASPGGRELGALPPPAESRKKDRERGRDPPSRAAAGTGIGTGIRVRGTTMWG